MCYFATYCPVVDCNGVSLCSLQRQHAGIQPRIELPNPTGPGVQTVQFGIPPNKCGLIIGKGDGFIVLPYVRPSVN